MTPPLLNQVQALAGFRLALASAQETYKQADAAFKLAHMDELQEIARLKELVEVTEAGVRIDAVKLAEATGSKHPAPGIEVKKCTTLTYDEGKALEWAIAHGVCVALDVAAFESLMLKTERPPVGLVSRNDAALKATIARDLPKALALVDVTAPHYERLEGPSDRGTGAANPDAIIVEIEKGGAP